MTRTRFVRSSHILAVIALAWVSALVLLHVAYAQPNLARQGKRIEDDTAGEWLRLANYFLRSRRGQMLRITADWADDAGVKAYFAGAPQTVLQGELSCRSLLKNRIRTVMLCDERARLLSAWKVDEGGVLVRDAAFPPGKEMGELSLFRLCAASREFSGVGNTPLGLALFARAALIDQGRDRPAGYLVSLRPVDETLFAELSAMVGVRVSLQPAPHVPPDCRVPSFGQAVWRDADHTLNGAEFFRDSSGSPVGYLVVRGKAEPIYQQTRTVEKALGTTLLWATGFSLLMMLAVHLAVSGPTARLLRRVRRLREGERVQVLSGGLRGEALALGRQFEEVLAHVEKLSQTDSLTSLSNRRSFQHIFLREFRRARRYTRNLALAMIDLDFFKAINDALGHQTGDLALKLCAEVVANNVRTSDSVARLGGDEFAILMPETTVEEAVNVAERFRAALGERTVGRGELKMSLTASIGVADMNVPGGDTPEAFLDLADQALYAAKRSGRNRTVRADRAVDKDAWAISENDDSRVDHLYKELTRLDAKFKRLFVDAIGGLISALEARDEHTANHSVKVRRYATLIARKMDLPDRAVEHLRRAAMLHDIGKIGLPDRILLKEGPLTEEEFEPVKRHPIMSVRIMEGMEFLDQEIPAVR